MEKFKYAPGKIKLNFGREIRDSSLILPFGKRTHLLSPRAGILSVISSTCNPLPRSLGV
jgi:hypothetical protein